MFLSGTFGLSEGVSLYPTDDLKTEYWSTYRRVTDLKFQVDVVREALERVADTFYTELDPSPSSAGTALSIAVDPTLVTFDMLRTALHLHLERAGVPSASLSTTLDKIQRHQQQIIQRGGNITKVEMTFFLPVEGYTMSPFGSIRSEVAEEAKAHAQRAAEEAKRTEREIKATEKQERVAELQERASKDKTIVEAKAEVERLRARIAELETKKAAKDEEVRVAETFQELQEEVAVRATADAREAIHVSLERAEEKLAERAPERAAVTQDEIASDISHDVAVEVVERKVEKKEKFTEAKRWKRAEAKRKKEEKEERLAKGTQGAYGGQGRQGRAEQPKTKPAKPTKRPTKPVRVPWNKKTKDRTGRWRDTSGRFTSPPKKLPKKAPKRVTKKTSKKPSSKKTSKKVKSKKATKKTRR